MDPVRVAVTILALAVPGLSAAAELHHDGPRFVPVHDCTCRYKGEDVALHQRRCLATPQGPRTAECVMEQNVTSWRALPDACPLALRDAPQG